MATVDKRTLSERDICTQYITPSIQIAGWNIATQVREEVNITKGQVLVQGVKATRGRRKFADYVLYSYDFTGSFSRSGATREGTGQEVGSMIRYLRSLFSTSAT